MSTVVGVAAETRLGERRAALVPAAVAQLVESDFQVLVEAGCGSAAGFFDAEFAEAGAEIVESSELYERSQVIACVSAVRRPALLHPGQIVVGMLQPWRHPVLIEHWARRGVTMVSLDRVPPLPQATVLTRRQRRPGSSGGRRYCSPSSTSADAFR
jgi:NAD(P) transhydrogenase subunit alpha